MYLYLILDAGNLISAHCHLARTIARRAERRLWALNKKDVLLPEILIFVNRLSDLFFVMARVAMQREGSLEEKWKDECEFILRFYRLAEKKK